MTQARRHDIVAGMTRTLLQYQIDAFAAQAFEGNPAAVILTPAPLDEALMQTLAQENNLSETAYLVPRSRSGHYDLRWFTPTTEIEFCGHATIASAHALMAEHKAKTDEDGAYIFHAQIGQLRVTKSGLDYVLRAPVARAKPATITAAIRAAFPLPLKGAFNAGPNLYIVFERAQDVRALSPDFSAIVPLSAHGVGITARGDEGYDCVSRFFVPAEGINEDPVTGSAHAAIGPYWAKVLGKENVLAYQASARGGTLRLTVQGDFIDIAGPAVTVMQSQIRLPRSI